MTVYIDNAENEHNGIIMSHMMADTIDELHQMADRIGLSRLYFQNKKHPHYDVSQSKKALALKKGAVEVTTRELISLKHNKNPKPLQVELPLVDHLLDDLRDEV